MELPIVVPEPVSAVQVTNLTDTDRALFRVLDYPTIWEHIPGGPPASADALLERLLSPGRQPLAIRRAHALVGTSSYLFDAAEPDGIEIGATLLSPSAWGTGINATAKALMIGAAFAAGAHWVQLRTDERNGRSAAAIMKIPGAVELPARRERNITRPDGSVRTSRVFRIPGPDGRLR